jgi:predicted integral membrane protein
MDVQHSSIHHRLQVLAVWAIASLIGLLIFNLGGLDTPQTYWSAAKPSYLQHVAFWDSEWYYRVATQGYPDSTSLPIGQDGRVGQNTWAFMPIYAYLSGGLAGLLSANYYTCAVVVAWLGSALAALGLDAWMRPRVGKAASLLGVAIFFTCGPAIILQLPYAESLGLALVAIGFAVLAKRRFAWAMVVFVLAAFTRPIGVPLGAALGLWWVWEELRARGLISASRFDASFSSARVYADADPYAANYDAAAANAAPVPNEAAIASFETAPDLTASASFETAPQAIPAPPSEAGAMSPSEAGAVGTETTGSAHTGQQAGDSETSGPEASDSSANESATSAIASFEAAPIAASAEASSGYDVVANYEAATASNAPAPAPAPPALPSFTPMDLSPLPLSSKDRLWLFVTAAVTCAAALTWPLLAWIATGRMSAYVDTETAWRGVDLAPFEAWINRSASFGGAHAGVIGLFGVLVLSLCVLSWPQLRQLGRLTWMWCVCYWVYLLIFFDPSSSVFRMLLMVAPLAWAVAARLSKRPRAALAVLTVGLISQVLWVAWVWDYGSISILWVP